MLNVKNTIVHRFADLVAPNYCYGCANCGHVLCENCKYDIISEPFLQCIVCLEPTSRSDLCNECKKSRSYDDAWTVGIRDGVVKSLIDGSKYDSNRRGCDVQAQLLDCVIPALPKNSVIVPIPTIGPHIRIRGYGHTELIARELARLRSLEYCEIIGRTAKNYVQQGADLRTRKIQAEKSFVLKSQPTYAANYILVDDVYTTGSTLSAAAKLLRQGGAEHVSIAVTARQIMD